jgi:hypothetical protein
MNVAVNELAISVFKKPLTECSVADLRQLASQFPWFGPAQILYAKKLQAGSPGLYEDQVQKTILYFQNRLWLHYLLNDNESIEIITAPVVEEKTPADYKEKTGLSSPETFTVEIATEPSEVIETAVQEIEEKSQPIIEAATETFTPIPAIEEEKITERNTEEYNTEPLPEAAFHIAETTTITADQSENSGAEIEDPATDSPAETKTEDLVELPPIKFQPINTMNAPLTFEPYHTIDYFASQGIKVIEEEKPKQRFDQQLKSFTEWLKAMKRAPASEMAAAPDSGGEKKVVQLAEHSLAERHIVTEAMAEVWIKQGNTAKAEEIYRKLSLLDPLKTAYFAAKIEDLKKTS